MKQLLKWLSVLCLGCSFIQMYFIYIIPKSDSGSGPVLWLIYSVPAVLLQIILLLNFVVTDKEKSKKLLFLALLIFILMLLPFLILKKYY